MNKDIRDSIRGRNTNRCMIPMSWMNERAEDSWAT